ncbi:MAG: fused response regulator/phosphatase [Nitrosomonadales bacterium]|nr:fused response regulator/phosphatase [Nitrosomonadales bacterium]
MRILIVDDTRANLLLLSAMVEKMGYAATQADSGEQALELFAQGEPDMVLMDVFMPGMDGYETVQKIRRIATKWMPIIFVTAAGREDDLVRSIEAGGDDYLPKPLNYKVLQAKINVLFERLRLSRKLEEQNRLLLDYHGRNEEERQTAQEFMNRLLALDKINDPQVHFHLRAAEIFSGDLIAVARTPANHLYAMLADSTGHGLTAALAVMPTLQLFHTMAAKGYSIGAIAAEVNCKVQEYLPSNRFVAAVLVALDEENCRVSVWNGGCPPVALFCSGEAGVRQFDSRHLPMGVLKADEFDDEVEHCHYGEQGCQLLLCSDGAVDIADAASMADGMGRLLQAAQAVDAPAARLSAMVGMLEARLAGKPAFDDIALILIDCPQESETVPIPAQPVHSGAESLGAIAAQEQDEHQAKTEWQFALTLTAPQLRQIDAVPLLLNLVNQIELEGRELSRKLFLILSELFNNALDHGLLRLDSALKHDPQGMERYFEERAARLKRLAEGEINIRLQKISTTLGPCLIVVISDTGKGFDYLATLQVAAMETGMRRHGRGIMLVQSLSGDLQYSNNGAQAQVCIPLHDTGLCAPPGSDGGCKIARASVAECASAGGGA